MKFHQMALAEESPQAMAANRREAERIAELAKINQIIDELRAKRMEAGLSLADLSVRTGIAVPNLSVLERHPKMPPKLETLNRVASALGMRVDVRMVEA